MSSKTIRPEYYNTDSIYEPIKIIQHYDLDFSRGNCLKYILRAGIKNKETEIEDLIKAKTYLQLRIDYLESLKNQNYKKGGEVMQPLKVWNGDNLNPISEPEKKQWHDDVSPKLISELKVGDEIKAIDPCYINGYKTYAALTQGKMYNIESIYSESLRIIDDNGYDRQFTYKNLHEYFHVSKE